MRVRIHKGLALIGAVLIPLGTLGVAISWQEYWLRATAPSLTTAAMSIAPSVLIALVGVSAFATGTAGLDAGVRKRYLLLGLFVGVVILLILLLYYSIPLIAPAPARP